MANRWKRKRGAAFGASVICASAAALGLQGCSSVSALETRARLISNPACTDVFFPIYFANGSSELSKAAASVVANAGKHIDGCALDQVEVIGLADYVGTPEANLDLSRRRARAVAQALIHAGLPAPVFHINALGEAGAVTKDGPAPVRRRADVFIHFRH